jgi:hypothetical protein
MRMYRVHVNLDWVCRSPAYDDSNIQNLFQIKKSLRLPKGFLNQTNQQLQKYASYLISNIIKIILGKTNLPLLFSFFPAL